MADVSDRMALVTGEHRLALEWFHQHKGKEVAWSVLQQKAEEGVRLVNQAKGIYKPHYTQHALSVRTLQEGPYPDKEVECRPDGSWIAQYYQENSDPLLRDREATNRGLVICMEAGVPVGFLVKRKPKPGVTYSVLGLGLVTGWDAGYFTIEGFSSSGATPLREDDAARGRARYATVRDVPFDTADSEVDLRVRTLTQVAHRRGQAEFRASLLAAYDGKCCVTGCMVNAVLEAAHIVPYRGPQTNHPQNGLLLRSDIHTLFDLGHLALSDDFRVILSPEVMMSTHYKEFSGKQINLPNDVRKRPSVGAVCKHRLWSGLVDVLPKNCLARELR